MRVSENQYKSMPLELQALFRKCPNPGSDEVVELFPQTTSGKGLRNPNGAKGVNTKWGYESNGRSFDGDSGSAARFFYCAKASKADRDDGCEELEERTPGECTDRTDGSDGVKSPRAGAGRTSGSRNHHPTVKPTNLMRYLCRLVTPPGGIVLDPFMGSGSTGKAALLEGFNFIGIEREPEYMEIAKCRINFVQHTLKSKNDLYDLTKFINDEDFDNNTDLENKEL